MGRRVGAGLVLFQKLEVEITANEINYLVTFTDFEKISVSGSAKDLTIRQLAFVLVGVVRSDLLCKPCCWC
jgi:hypothetical protein